MSLWKTIDSGVKTDVEVDKVIKLKLDWLRPSKCVPLHIYVLLHRVFGGEGRGLPLV